MINREAFDKVGGFDYSFLHYCQDSDISLRIKTVGYKVGVAKGMRVVHFGGMTMKARVQGGDQSIGQQGGLDQMNFAKKHKVQCGQFDFREKGGYDKILADSQIFLRNQEASAKEFEKIMKEFPELIGKKALELGCAFGEIVRLMKAAGVDAVGYEREPAGVEKNKDCVVQKDLSGVWTEDKDKETFDFVFSRAVLEHLPEAGIDSFISQLRFVMKPGALTNHDIDTNQGQDPTHINIHGIEWWKERFKDFELVKCEHRENGVFNATWKRI